jgi:hypothetical protein
MKFAKPRPYAVLISLLLCCLSFGCGDSSAPVSFVKVESERTKLVNGIESYQSIEEFKASLAHSSLQWDESQEQPSPGNRWRPPFNEHTITIRNYSYLGFTGELMVIFFNNRLRTTIFYPSAIDEFVEAFCKSEGVKFDNNYGARISSHTLIRVTTDGRGRKYIRWSDIRLDREVELWITRNS